MSGGKIVLAPSIDRHGPIVFHYRWHARINCAVRYSFHFSARPALLPPVLLLGGHLKQREVQELPLLQVYIERK